MKGLNINFRKDLLRLFHDNPDLDNDCDEITRILNIDYGHDATEQEVGQDLDWLMKNGLVKFDEKMGKLFLTDLGKKVHDKFGKEEDVTLDAKLEKNKVQILLSKPKPKYQSLGIGIWNNVFYYGTKIYEEDRGYDAVITSDKKIYVNWKNDNKIKKDFGLNYRFEFFDDLIDYTWSNKSIHEWLYGQPKIPTFKKIFGKIRLTNKKFMWYHDDRWHDFVSLDIIVSYFNEIFENRGRILIVAEKGSGKTRQSQIYQLFVFNPLMSPDWTKSALFRTIESTKGTPIIDNFDDVNEDLKNDIMCIFKQYKKGTKSVRTEGERKRKPVGYDLFCSMVLNNILGLKEVDEDRSNKIQLLKSKNKKIVNLRRTLQNYH